MASIVSTLGSGSGIDIRELTASLVAAQFAPKLARLEGRGEQLDAQISAAATIRNQFTSLSDALAARVRSGDLARAPVSADPSVVTVALAEGARPDRLDADVVVQRLARAQTVASPAFSTAEQAPGSGTLTIRLGDGDGATAIEVPVAAGQSLASVAEAINAAAGDAVHASIVRSDDGARLVLKGPTGARNGFAIVVRADDPDGGLRRLSYPGEAAGAGMTLGQAATDSRVTVDGIAIERPTNRLADVLDGVTLDLRSAAEGRQVHLSLARPAAAIGTALGDFVSALDQVRATLAAASDPKTGELRTDSATRAAGRAVSRFTSVDLMPGAEPGAPRTLAELGVRTARDGSLSLDQAQFERAVALHPDGVEALFAVGLHGLDAAVTRLARSVTSAAAPGSLAASVDRYGRLKAQVATERSKLDAASDRLRDSMTAQFARMDSRVAGFRSTQSFLDNQIRAWNADRG